MEREALKLALEAITQYLAESPNTSEEAIEKLCDAASAARKALAQPAQKPVTWKLVPIEPTDEMIKAMDECSTEGYDERLYAGHAASVYMAAVDVAPTPPQPAQDYIDKKPLGGPAKVFDAIADCIRAGDSIESVMATYGLAWAQDVPETGFGNMAQPAQEPVTLVIDGVLVKSALPEKYTGHLYTTPPQREWNAALDKAAARINEITAFPKTTQDSFAVFIKGLKR